MPFEVWRTTLDGATSSGDQDYTESGRPTPLCALYLTDYNSGTLGTTVNNGGFCVGFSDGASNYVSAVSDWNNKTTVNSWRRYATNECVMRLAPAAGNVRAEGTATMISGGSRVNWGNPEAGNKKVTAIHFSSDHADAASKVGGLLMSASDAGEASVSIGFQPDFVILATSWLPIDDLDTTKSDGSIAVGFAERDGGSESGSAWFNESGLSTSAPLAWSTNTSTLADAETGIEANVTIDSDGFTVTTTLPSGATGVAFGVGYIAVSLGGQLYSDANVTRVKTDDGTQTTTVGFDPDCALIGQCYPDNVNSQRSGASAQAFGLGWFSETDEIAHSCFAQDNVGTTIARSLASAQAFGAPATTGTTQELGTVDSFTSTAVVIDYTSTPIAADGFPAYLALGQRHLIKPTSVATTIEVPAVALLLGGIQVSPEPVSIQVTNTTTAVSFGAATVSPDPVAVPLVAPSASNSSSLVTLAPDAVKVPINAPAASIAPGTTAVAPSPVAVPLVVPLAVPTASVGSGLTISPSAVPIAISAPSATISFGALTLSPDAVSIQLTAAAAAAVLGAVAVSPDAVAILMVVPNAAVGAGQQVAAGATAIPILVPAISLAFGSVTLTPDAVAIPLNVPAASVGSITVIQPSPVPISLSAPEAILSLGATTVSPTPVQIPISAVTPALTAAGISLAPDAVAVAIGVPGVAISNGSTLAPSALSIPIIVPSVGIVLGGTVISPSPLAIPIGVPFHTMVTVALTANVLDGGVIYIMRSIDLEAHVRETAGQDSHILQTPTQELHLP